MGHYNMKTIVFRVGKQWDYCTIVRSLHFTLSGLGIGFTSRPR